MPRAKKGGTPDWIDKLLEMREVISEEEYRKFWKRINRVRNRPEKERKAVGEKILAELEAREKAELEAREKAELEAREKAELEAREKKEFL